MSLFRKLFDFLSETVKPKNWPVCPAGETVGQPILDQGMENHGRDLFISANVTAAQGWMHNTLDYFSKDLLHRMHHQNLLTFRTMYANSENFVLSLSLDEVVHGKRSLLEKMPGLSQVLNCKNG